MNISVVVPAHNEEDYLAACLEAVRHSASLAGQATYDGLEIVVVLNRPRPPEGTEYIAGTFDATIVLEDAKNLAVIRNAGIRAAKHDCIVTVDADTVLHKATLGAVITGLGYLGLIGGSIPCRLERMSLALHGTCERIGRYLPTGIPFGGGAFWFRRADFEAVGGFDEKLCTVEDVDFAIKLRHHGELTDRGYSTTLGSGVTSCRKFDQFGDHLPDETIRRIFKGNDQAIADEFYYDVRS